MIDAESAVLGAVLLDSRTYWRVADLIGADDFSSGKHRRLWEVLSDLIREGSAADAVTVGEHSPSLADFALELAATQLSTAMARSYAETMARKATERRVIAAGQRIASLRGADSLEEAQRILAACAPKSAGQSVTLKKAMREWFTDLQRRFDAPEMTGVPTGLPWLDSMLGGYQRSDLIILAARPSVGKTALGVQSAVAVASAGTPVLFISAEMATGQLCGRIASHMSGVSTTAFRQPQDIDDEGWRKVNDAVARVPSMPLVIDDKAITVEAISAQARQLDATQRLGLIVVDYLTHLKLPKADRHDLSIGEATRALKRLGKDLNVPVLLLAQLNRDGANRRPTLSDLRGSGDIEQDADVVLFLHRPDEQQRDGIELIVAKHRNGECGDCFLHADMQRQRFTLGERPQIEQAPRRYGFGRDRQVVA